MGGHCPLSNLLLQGAHLGFDNPQLRLQIRDGLLQALVLLGKFMMREDKSLGPRTLFDLGCQIGDRP